MVYQLVIDMVFSRSGVSGYGYGDGNGYGLGHGNRPTNGFGNGYSRGSGYSGNGPNETHQSYYLVKVDL